MSVNPPERQPALSAAAKPERLLSLDALRGFDMFWIIGGGGLLESLSRTTGWPILQLAAAQTEHPEWNGFKFWDLIFPTFMFVAGVAMPFAITARLERGEAKPKLYRRVFRRALLLVLLGLVVNGALQFDFVNQRYPSVLGRIGLGYLFAALIVMNCSVRAQGVWIAGILVGYWAAMRYVPVPGFGPGDWYPGHNLVDYIDRNLLPGRLYKIVRDPEGLFSTVPAVATVLMGALAGAWLRHSTRTGAAKAAGIAVAGLVSLGLGWMWNHAFPINKNLWTSSFVLYAGGWSLLLLASFYLVIDVWQFRRWAFFFVVIGVNAITVYVAQEIVDFQRIAAALLNKGGMHAVLYDNAGLVLRWVFLYVLYRFGVFLKV